MLEDFQTHQHDADEACQATAANDEEGNTHAAEEADHACQHSLPSTGFAFLHFLMGQVILAESLEDGEDHLAHGGDPPGTKHKHADEGQEDARGDADEAGDTEGGHRGTRARGSSLLRRDLGF